MLPTESLYGQWPRSGEIDIVEVRGNQDLTCRGEPIGRQVAGSTLHWVSDLITINISMNQNAFLKI